MAHPCESQEKSRVLASRQIMVGMQGPRSFFVARAMVCNPEGPWEEEEDVIV